MALGRARVTLSRTLSVVDLFVLLGLVLLVYALVGVAHQWAGPYRPKTDIDLGLPSLVLYSILSLVRVSIGYILSLVFTFTYGYAAAKSRVGEMILIPLLDILQSIPVLGFMPGLVLALVNLFPNTNLGLELAAIIMIFSGQGWNMVFSFYSSLKTVPNELKEMTSLYRLSKFDVLRSLELPFAMNGLLWNSMLSMAGGWFFVMTIESFSLGERDFRLPGIGSYMAVAYDRGDVRAILAGIAAMFILIILVDRCIWAPLVVWSERFKYDRDAHGPLPRSMVLEWLKRSRFLDWYLQGVDRMRGEFEKRRERPVERFMRILVRLRRYYWIVKWGRYVILFAMLAGAIYGARSAFILLSATQGSQWLIYFRDTCLTFVRVVFAVLLGSLWTIPVGVFIGVNPKWTMRLQPVTQVVASFPAPMLFPMIVYVLLKMGIGLEVGSVVLMLFASQWYILFNVISGATRIPHQLIDFAAIFQIKGRVYWKAIILPAIFPSLVNGWITAAGGAWNACIVSEFVLYQDKQLTATGIGAAITQAAQKGDFPALAASILMMVTTVVLLNRFFWGALYRLAETRFRLEY